MFLIILGGVVNKMSYQRAVINCRRCYALSKMTLEDSNTRETNMSNLIRNSSIHNSRDQALQALEGEMETHSYSTPYATNQLTELCRKALTACIGCKYKQAEIAEIFDSSEEKSE